MTENTTTSNMTVSTTTASTTEAAAGLTPTPLPDSSGPGRSRRWARVAGAAVTAIGLGAGAFVGVGPAQADTAPAPAAGAPNLHLEGGVFCTFGIQPGKPWGESWSMTRYMKVTAQNGAFRNVTLQELGGQNQFKKDLKAGESLEIKTVWFGCFPSSISGYTISDYGENLLDNAGFWWNVRQIQNPRLLNG